MIHRDMETKLLEMAAKYPAVSITGPRQSGKTTLAKQAFPHHAYLSFENPDTRALFEDDPRAFLSLHSENVIFDEAQRVPELFSYLQEIIDSSDAPGRFVITGSQNFLLLKAVGQSLAGRVALFTLPPLSYHELASAGLAPKTATQWVFEGGYPRLFHSDIHPQDFFPEYVETYLQRDVRDELGVRSLSTFMTFLRLCALSCGELLNMSTLSSDCGIDVKTARGWISILEASHIIYLLQPHFSNARKRLVKSPKLYFLDTGLACNLMGIPDAEGLLTNELYGHLFESAVISEVLKCFFARGRKPDITFWRDSNGNEVDLLLERGLKACKAIEIKSSTTYRAKYFDVLTRVAEGDLKLDSPDRAVIYGGETGLQTARGELVSFREIDAVIAGR